MGAANDGLAPGNRRQQQRGGPGERECRAQADVLAQPATEQRARPGGQTG